MKRKIKMENKEQRSKKKQIIGFSFTLVLALVVLILVVSVINVSQHNIVGRASYRQIQVYGDISPDLPDGTQISFKVGIIEIGSGLIKNNS